MRVLRSRAAINEMLWADYMPFADVFYSHTVIRPSSPQKVLPNTTVEYISKRYSYSYSYSYSEGHETVETSSECVYFERT